MDGRVSESILRETASGRPQLPRLSKLCPQKKTCGIECKIPGAKGKERWRQRESRWQVVRNDPERI